MYNLSELLYSVSGILATALYGCIKLRYTEQVEFRMATDFYKMELDTVEDSLRMKLYGLYKQAVFGDYSGSPVGQTANVAAWNGCRGLSRRDASRKYVISLDARYPNWRECVTQSKLKSATTQSDNGHNFTSWASGSVLREAVGSELGSDFSLGGRLCELAAMNDLEKLKIAFSNQESSTNVNITDVDGMSCLHWACDRGSLDIVEFLLKRQASVTIQDKEGNTPLHLACISGHEEVLLRLLESADSSSRLSLLRIANNDGECVLDLMKVNFPHLDTDATEG